MTGGIPSAAIGAAVGVLIYSVLCLVCCILVVCLLLRYGEKFSYVTLLSSFTAISTFASIIQQIHYTTSWAVIKQAQYDNAVKSLTTPSLAFSGAAEKTDVVLFSIQFYCYNVMSLNVLFWSVGLFCGSWEVGSHWLGNWRDRLPPLSKIFAILFPGVVIGIAHIKAIIDITPLFFVITNITMVLSMSVGSIMLVLILYKYMRTRRLVLGHGKRGGWWASGGSKEISRDVGSEGTTDSTLTTATQRSLYDRALVTRFTIGFVILAIFEAAIIFFSLFQRANNTAIARSGGPNHTIANTIADILLFIPGVTASLVVFLVFGTTKSLRQYRDLIVGGCGIRRRLHERQLKSDGRGRSQDFEFERLPSISNSGSQEAAKSKEVESRVRMFSIQALKSPIPEVEPPKNDKATRIAGFTQFHKPLRPNNARVQSTKEPRSKIRGPLDNQYEEDPVVQREHQGPVETFIQQSTRTIQNEHNYKPLATRSEDRRTTRWPELNDFED